MLSVLPNDTRLGGRASTGSHSSSARRWLRLCSACFHNKHEMSCTQSRRTCADAQRSVYVDPGSRLRNHSSNASPSSPTFSVSPRSDVYSRTIQQRNSYTLWATQIFKVVRQEIRGKVVVLIPPSSTVDECNSEKNIRICDFCQSYC